MAHNTEMVQNMKSTPDDCTPRSLSNWIRNVASNWSTQTCFTRPSGQRYTTFEQSVCILNKLKLFIN